MQYFLKKQSEKVWNIVEFGCSPPKVLDKEGTPTKVIKPKLEQDKGGNEASKNKAKVMLWTRIFHVRPHSISETRFFICEKLFSFGKVGAATYFIFILKGK